MNPKYVIQFNTSKNYVKVTGPGVFVIVCDKSEATEFSDMVSAIDFASRADLREYTALPIETDTVTG